MSTLPRQPDEPSPAATSSLGFFGLLRWLGRQVRPHWFLAAALAFGLLLNQAFENFLPLSFKYLIDDAILPGNRRLLGWLLGALAAGALISSVSAFCQDYLYARLGIQVLNDLRLRIFVHLQQLSLNYFSRTPAGQVLARFAGDLHSVEATLISTLPQGLVSLFSLLVSTVMLFALEWRLALIAAVGMTLSMFSVKLLEKRSTAATYKMKAEESLVTVMVQENLAAQAVIKGYGLREMMVEGFKRQLHQLFRSSMRAKVLSYVMERAPQVGMALVTVVILGVGALLAFRKTITVGTLVSFNALLASASAAVGWLTWLVPHAIDAAVSMQRLNEVLLEQPQVEDAPGAQPLPAIAHGIKLERVTFGYKSDEPTLHEVDLEIPRGHSLALVGPSGAGKSSVLNLLLRFYDPTKGRVMVDGRDLREVTQDSLRAQIGAVFQESFLFNTSIRENIRLGRPDAGDQEIEAAASLAEAADFIRELPEGYTTICGERGGRLSGGQRQRVALARALVRNPAILLLDEATSGLDPRTEAAFLGTLERLRRRCTLVCVTHRLAPVVSYDRIVVLDGGRLVEQGTHTELLERQGLYARLWADQGRAGAGVEDIVPVKPEPQIASI